MNLQFLQSLSRIDQILYKTSYDFEIKYCEATSEEAHQAGLKKIKKTKDLVQQLEKPQTYVDVSTGKTFKCTESQLISKFS